MEKIGYCFQSVALQCVHCCKGNTASQWEGHFWGCQNTVTSEPVD